MIVVPRGEGINEIDAEATGEDDCATPSPVSSPERPTANAFAPAVPAAAPMNTGSSRQKQRDGWEALPVLHLRAKHASLKDLCDEWNGLEKFEDPHGGFEGRETRIGSHWRKHLVSNHQFSRTKRVVAGIRRQATESDISECEAVATCEEEFKRCDFGVEAMTKSVQTGGVIPKQKD